MKARGISMVRVASILNAKGLRCRGGRWHVTRVRVALSKRAGGVDLVTSHVVCLVIERGLESLERELGTK
jgi:hypothetical protein